MKWGKLRPWFGLVGPLVAVVVLTAAPAGVKAGELPWPKWLVAGVVAAGGVLVAVWTPQVKARADALAARTTRAAERDAQAEEALNRLPTLKGKVLLVKDVTDRALLGIHEAIPLPTDGASQASLSAELPTYVLRDIDADLRTALAARSKTGGFVLLVGPAAAGKTRCAYEAIQAVLPHWRLFMPPDAATLSELVTGGADLKNSVVWLNETQNFLTGPERLKAATVRRILADTVRPVVLIGTIWPATYDQLRTAATTDDEDEDGQDLNKDAREVLELARRFSLRSWSDQEWERAEELASTDPRIGQVLHHRGQGGLAQMMSAAPELIHRWEQADNPFGQAVITATVVARRCNHPATVPVPVIEALAKEFLPGSERATAGEGWLTEALTWACQPVHHSGGIAPLQAFGEAMGRVDGYQVSDILVYHERLTSQVATHQSSARIWELLLDLATPEACFSIGEAAYLLNRTVESELAWKRAAEEGGSVEAMFNLGSHLREQGDTQGANTWLQRAAESGHTRAMTNLGALLHDLGDTEGAQTWARLAAEAGLSRAMFNLAVLLVEQEDIEGGRTWYTRAAEAGHVKSMSNLGSLLATQGDTEGARTWLQRAADTGHTPAMFNLGGVLKDHGDFDGARKWLQRAADAGDLNSSSDLGVLLLELGRTADARIWLQHAADAGHTVAMFNLGASLQKQGDHDGARPWLERAAEGDLTNAMINLSTLLRDQGDHGGARAWLLRAAEAGDLQGMAAFASVLREEGDTEGARTWWTRAADSGDVTAMSNLGALLRMNGDTEGARTWLRRAADAGNTSAMFNLGNTMRDAGDTEGARTWWTQAANAGHAKAMTNLGGLLYELGDTEGARTWLQRAADTGLPGAMFNLGGILYELGDTEGARAWLQRAGDAGEAQAQAALPDLDDGP